MVAVDLHVLCVVVDCELRARRPWSKRVSSSAASDVYKVQVLGLVGQVVGQVVGLVGQPVGK